MKLKVYIASKFSSRYRLRPIKFKLKQLGFEVLSDWIDNNPLDETIGGDYDSIGNHPDASDWIDNNPLDETIGGDYDSIGNHPDASHDIAERDRTQVLECDIFIIDTQDVSETGGRECELGMALMAIKPYIFRIGPIRNVFHAHKSVRHVKTWEDLLVMLELL